jgi:(4S)-4-hydroxy-5-phosphonooxypentane-2,3-dione isomerase
LRSRLGLQRGYCQCEASRRLSSQPPLHVLVVEYDIVVGEIDKYLTAVKELGAASVKEAGFRQQYITISQNDPNHVLLFEAWDNAAAHAAHVATDRFKKYQATTGNMIAKRNVRTFSSVAMLSP